VCFIAPNTKQVYCKTTAIYLENPQGLGSREEKRRKDAYLKP
jgi:hypothetical protein